MLTNVPGRRVLVTNWDLVHRGGSELYVRDLALGLLRRGQEPLVWSPTVGPMAEEIRAAGVQVVDDLDASVLEPDLLHCQHHDETLAALARFPDRPGLFIQHGTVPWQEKAPLHARLLRYVAVDELCREDLLASGIEPDRTTVIPNSVDLDRFSRRDPLPLRPRRALVLSNYAREDNYLPVVRAACRRLSIELDVAGLGVGAPMDDPEVQLRGYDIVFGKARVALEALAVGCAVVVMDQDGVAGMTSHAALPDWLRWNLGRHLLTTPADEASICDALDRYDPDDAARCSDHVRAHCGLESMIDAIVAEHDRVLAAWTAAPPPDHRAELQAASARLQLIGPLRRSDELLSWHLREQHHLSEKLAEATRLLEDSQVEREALRVERDALRGRRAVRWVETMASRRNGRTE
jgi:glycosyltransferase involved in cell wall biosynthesis